MSGTRSLLHERIAIVGTGLAGVSAAERLRERGYSGSLVMIGGEEGQPYNRTPLSKQLLAGTRSPKDIRLRTYTPLDASWLTGDPATQLDLDRRTIHLKSGSDVCFDRLVIATGSTPRHLPGAPMHSRHVWGLRTLEDARGIDAAMARGQRIAVVGGGFIGCEIASTARERGLDVTLIDRSPVLLRRSLGDALGAVATDLHRNAGVRLHLGVAVAGWTETRRGVEIDLDDGETIAADLAVVGIGTDPDTAWLQQTSLNTEDGILCDSACRVLDNHGTPLPGVVAAGDAARWPNQRFGATPRRIEHWINAIEMGRHAADTLLADPGNERPFAPIPRFWSHQHGTRIQSAGIPALGSSVHILEGSVPKRRFLAAFTGAGGNTTGLIAFNAPRALLKNHHLINGVAA
ncbi:MAG: FAD-dependent oxidoreductase [Microbacteriaceae bacterium]|nr:MAG: FAD-dependent oxidoreductase [Microbacteriaceae bacterium]